MDLSALSKLAQFANVRVEDLTHEHLHAMADALGYRLEITDELLSAVVTCLRGESIHKAADLIRSPQSMAQLVAILRAAVVPITRPRDNIKSLAFWSSSSRD